MPTVRFVREAKDVRCQPGENLRSIALKSGIELYGFKGKIGNCGGCGQCITCFVAVEGGKDRALSGITNVEKIKLANRPKNWRLACQAVVESSVLILTRPQSPPSNLEEMLEQALEDNLPK